MTTVASLPAAGRALDALIAEKVMGWPHEQMLVGTGADYDVMHLEPPRAAYRRRSHVDGFWERWSPTGADVIVSDTVPPYSTDIACAWEVVEKLDEKWFVKIEKRGDRREEGRYFERWACHLWPGDFEAEAETAPLAICLSALQAVAALKAVAL